METLGQKQEVWIGQKIQNCGMLSLIKPIKYQNYLVSNVSVKEKKCSNPDVLAFGTSSDALLFVTFHFAEGYTLSSTVMN